MSEKNIALLRRWTEAFNAREVDAMLAHCDPSIEMHSVFAAVGGTVYRGHDGLRRWQRDLEGAWGEEIGAEPEAYVELGERTLVFYVMHGRGKHSGVEVRAPVATVFRWRDGLMVYYKGYTHRPDALRDMGVSEGDMRPVGLEE